MAFKSKTPLNAFDKNNTSAKNLEFNSLKSITKGGVKKLAAAEEAETPFYLILDYFKDNKDKPLAHFLDFGINVKLEKHFEQVEMKPGKLDKSMSGSAKEAASGIAYVKKVNGTDTLHFQPAEQCKIPSSKWLKIIKALKPYLAGFPAIVVLGEEKSTLSEETTETDKQGSVGDPLTAREAKMIKLENNLAAIEKALGMNLENV
jgi:hypothetical protein